MTLHKDKNGNLHDDMGGTALALFPADLGPYVEITDAEAETIRAAQNPAPSANSLILAQIDQIERDTQMNRAVREGMLLLIEKEAMREFSIDLPTAQAGLYAGNAAYKKVKDIDNQIVALRAQLT